MQKRFLWPPVPDAARLEYLGFYAGDQDLKRGDSVPWLTEYVFGQDIPVPLFKRPFAIDARFGKVVVTDTTSRQVVLFDLSTKTIAPIKLANRGVGKQQSGLGTPTGVAFAGPAEIWLADSLAREVSRFALDGKFLGNVGRDQLTRPTALAIDHKSQRAIIVDTAMHRLAVFGLDGTFLGYLGERGTGAGQFNFPLDVDLDADGDLYVLDSLNARVQRFSWDAGSYRYRTGFGERGLTTGSFQMAKALAVSPSGHVYVTDSLADKILVFDRSGTFLLNFGGRSVASEGRVTPGGLNMPAGISVDENDSIWVVDSLNAMVHRFQYLNEAYLRAHPIFAEQVVLPAALTQPGVEGSGRVLENGNK